MCWPWSLTLPTPWPCLLYPEEGRWTPVCGETLTPRMLAAWAEWSREQAVPREGAGRPCRARANMGGGDDMDPGGEVPWGAHRNGPHVFLLSQVYSPPSNCCFFPNFRDLP